MAALPAIAHEEHQEAEELIPELKSLQESWDKYHELYRQVRGLPQTEKINPLYFVMDELFSQHPQGRRATLNEALGRLRSTRPAPDDAEVRQMVENEQMLKYS